MTVHEGDLTVSEDGAVVDRVVVNGSINVRADGVIIRDVIVRTGGYYPIWVHDGHTGALIEHCEIAGTGRHGTSGVKGSDLVLRACEIHGVEDGVKIGSRSLYEGNWIHAPSPTERANPDGMQMMSGNDVVIRGNHIDYPATEGTNAAIILKTDAGPIDDVLIEGNWLDGGNYTLYSRKGSGRAAPTDVSVTGNRFGTTHKFGVLSTDGAVLRSDNVWGDEPEPEPDTGPTEEAEPQPDQEPGEEPGDEAGEQPGDEPREEPGDEAGEEPTGEGSQEPTREPSEEPTPQPTPAPAGRPGASNTGPRVGEKQMAVRHGGLTVTEDGAVVERLVVNGEINVRADNVTIRDVIVRTGGYYPVRVHRGFNGTVIEHCEIAGSGNVGTSGVKGNDLVLRACEIHGVEDGAKVGSGSVYERNWIHSPTVSRRAHADGLQMMSGRNVVIRGNRIDYPPADGSNAAIILKTDFGPIDDVVIEDNWLDGGNYTVYSRRGSRYAAPTNVSITGTLFGRSYRYGLYSLQGRVHSAGNVWADTGNKA